MATNLSLDPNLVEQAFQLSGESSKETAITQALQEFIARRQQQKMVDLFGTLDWDKNFDYKAERERSCSLFWLSTDKDFLFARRHVDFPLWTESSQQASSR